MTILADLQAVNRAISGVTSAPDGSGTYPMPAQINAVDLPCVLLVPAVIDITADSRNAIEATQTFNGIVLVTSQASGVGVDTSFNAVLTVLDAFHARYKTLIGTTEELSGGVVVTSYHDEGQKKITYRGMDWLGFEVKIETWEPV